eukprot:TRINITY_DN2505_c0_g1_i2.p1 TRINITY_DN2505_c0_g1~~TRINITY_DN2505_c0_g1_i2.p1  ORF type:complete len:526 (+),score=113.34 TRINITY_DN2505_c0_g1_i2:74-1651(+)
MATLYQRCDKGHENALTAFRAAFGRHTGLECALAALGFTPTAADAADLARRLDAEDCSLRDELAHWAVSLLPEEQQEAAELSLDAALDALREAAGALAHDQRALCASGASASSAAVPNVLASELCCSSGGMSYYSRGCRSSSATFAAAEEAAAATAFGKGEEALIQPTAQPRATPPAAQPEPEPPEPELSMPTARSRVSSADAIVASVPDWEVDPSELVFQECLGVGTSAEVHRASWYGTDVAVKVLLPRRSGRAGNGGDTAADDVTAARDREFRRELAVLPSLRHPHLVLFMGASTIGRPLIVSELCAGGALFRLLHQRPDVCLTWPQRQKIALDATKGLGFLHLRRVVHRDVKSLNMLLAAPCTGPADVVLVKIADFGLSRRLPIQEPVSLSVTSLTAAGTSNEGHVMTAGIGTWQWMAPEVLDGRDYDEKADVYSFGMVLFELLARRVPFDDVGLAPDEVVAAVVRGCRPFLGHVPASAPSGLRATMQRCWDPNSSLRPSFQGMLDLLRSSGPVDSVGKSMY